MCRIAVAKVNHDMEYGTTVAMPQGALYFGSACGLLPHNQRIMFGWLPYFCKNHNVWKKQTAKSRVRIFVDSKQLQTKAAVNQDRISEEGFRVYALSAWECIKMWSQRLWRSLLNSAPRRHTVDWLRKHVCNLNHVWPEARSSTNTSKNGWAKLC